MPAEEKRAWFALLVCSLTLVAIAAVYLITGSPSRAAGGLGVLGLTGLMPLIGLGRKRRGEVISDERDRAITQTAARIAFGLLWLASVGVVMALLITRGEAGAVSVGSLAISVMAAMLFFYAAYSVATIVLYRSGGER